MTIKLYFSIVSPPSRATLLTLMSLGIPYELKNLNLMKGEHLTEDFQKLNPQHTVPTIEDDGFVIWDSHAINVYLVKKYGKDDKLYPSEPKAQAVVDQRLHFDTGVLFNTLINIVVELLLKKTIKTCTPEMIASVENAFTFVEKFLQGNLYITGDTITIADFSFATTISNINIYLPGMSKKFTVLEEYLKRCEENIPSLKSLNNEARKYIEPLLAIRDFQSSF